MIDANQKFDLVFTCKPKFRTTKTKVMILVHGGGWTSGDKSNMDYYQGVITTRFS